MNSKEKKTQRIMMLSGASRAAMQVVDKTKQTKFFFSNNLNEIPMAMKMNLLFSITSKLRAIRSSTPNQ